MDLTYDDAYLNGVLLSPSPPKFFNCKMHCNMKYQNPDGTNVPGNKWVHKSYQYYKEADDFYINRKDGETTYNSLGHLVGSEEVEYDWE
ncbi:hypothetical protein BGZ96_005051 [Linnemannia gamsii]|uniref:Uncharacterized protein n=1 Tax=Linnemannia gamsii TaxID=64522 RepID=A0ABQ7K5G0_9FUNG|nr:hypothetical protein BGZ96_005051 [Linnemannia gamsii]